MPTTGRGYRYPSSSDDVRPYEDIQFLATDVNDDIDDITTAAETTTGLTAASGFTVNSFRGRKVNGVCTVWIYLAVTSTINITSGTNIADTQCATIPAGYRPPDTTGGVHWGDGTCHGECTIGSDGVVTLRTASGQIPSGRNIRIYATYVQ